MVTGISVIIGGTSQIHKQISAYHWEFVANLAWFSAVTHLITLTALRDDIHHRRIRSVMTWLRIFGMAILMMLLMFALYPMGYLLADDRIPAKFPAFCLYHPELEWKYEQIYGNTENSRIDYPISSYHHYNWVYVIFAYIALVYSFTTRVVFLQKGGWNLKHPRFLTHTLNPASVLGRWTTKLKGGRRSILRVVGYKILRTNYALLISSIDLYRSTLWEVSRLTSVSLSVTNNHA